MFDKTRQVLKAGLQESVTTPVKQSMVVSVVAIVVAIIALLVSAVRSH